MLPFSSTCTCSHYIFSFLGAHRSKKSTLGPMHAKNSPKRTQPTDIHFATTTSTFKPLHARQRLTTATRTYSELSSISKQHIATLPKRNHTNCSTLHSFRHHYTIELFTNISPSPHRWHPTQRARSPPARPPAAPLLTSSPANTRSTSTSAYVDSV